MNSLRRRPSPLETRRPASFWLWGWAMLLVVLLSAAPSGSQVRTRLLGSAFDPASVSVVVSPKRLRLNGGAASLSPDRRKTGTTPHQIASRFLRSLVVAARTLLPRAAEAVTAEAAAATPQPFSPAHGPRAPPTS